MRKEIIGNATLYCGDSLGLLRDVDMVLTAPALCQRRTVPRGSPGNCIEEDRAGVGFEPTMRSAVAAPHLYLSGVLPAREQL